MHRFLLLHRANALRVAGRYAAGAADYQQLWQTPGEFRDDAGYWLADYSFLQGRFSEALSGLDQLTEDPAGLRGEILRLQGHVHRVNALFDQAEARYRQALDLARQTGNVAAEGKALTDLIQTLSWYRPAEALDLQPRALDTNQAVRNQVEIVKIHAATAVAMTNQGNPGKASTQIRNGLELTEQCRYPGGRVWCQVARTLTQIRQGDTQAARQTAASLADTVSELQGNRFWSEIVSWWTSPDDTAQPATTSWLDGTTAARDRWMAVLTSAGTA